MRHPVIIVGGGIAGLRTASFLQKKNISFILLEARNRTGGRILTETVDGHLEGALKSAEAAYEKVLKNIQSAAL